MKFPRAMVETWVRTPSEGPLHLAVGRSRLEWEGACGAVAPVTKDYKRCPRGYWPREMCCQECIAIVIATTRRTRAKDHRDPAEQRVLDTIA